MKIAQWVLIGTTLLLPAPMFAQNPPSRAEIDAERAALFAQADADGNGTLSPSELKTFESLVHEKMAARHFARLDTNGDGAISLDEMQAGQGKHGFGPHSCGQ